MSPDNLLIDPVEVEKKITGNTKAVIAIDYAGHPCDYDALRDVANRHGLTLIADACHAAGGNFRERPVGSLADFSTFSFHPVKHMTTGEGGMVTTDSAEFAEKMRIFRNHGITTDHRQRQQQGSWFYEMTDLGFNYRITDIQCALGISQLRKLPEWVEKRREIAAFYDREFRALSGVVPLTTSDDVHHAYHLYVVRTSASRRNQLFDTLRAKGVGVNVHYIPVHLHPYYRQTFNTGEGLCPNAETAYEQILSLPIYPELKVAEQEYVIETLFALT